MKVIVTGTSENWTEYEIKKDFGRYKVREIKPKEDKHFTKVLTFIRPKDITQIRRLIKSKEDFKIAKRNIPEKLYKTPAKGEALILKNYEITDPIIIEGEFDEDIIIKEELLNVVESLRKDIEETQSDRLKYQEKHNKDKKPTMYSSRMALVHISKKVKGRKLHKEIREVQKIIGTYREDIKQHKALVEEINTLKNMIETLKGDEEILKAA